MHVQLLKELDVSISNLLLEVSVVPEQVEMIRDMKDTTSDRGCKGKLTRLEGQIKKQRASINKKTKKLQKLHKNLANLLKILGNARHA